MYGSVFSYKYKKTLKTPASKILVNSDLSDKLRILMCRCPLKKKRKKKRRYSTIKLRNFRLKCNISSTMIVYQNETHWSILYSLEWFSKMICSWTPDGGSTFGLWYRSSLKDVRKKITERAVSTVWETCRFQVRLQLRITPGYLYGSPSCKAVLSSL